MNVSMARRLLFGLFLIGLGAVFLAGQLGYVRIEPTELAPTYWPVILIVIGLSGLVGQLNSRGNGSLVWNLFLIALGVGFLLKNLGYLNMGFYEFIKLLIPVFIIMIGIRMIVKPGVKANTQQTKDYTYKYEYKYEPAQPAQVTAPESNQQPSFAETAHHHGAPPAWTNGENRSGFIGDLYLGQDYWDLKPMNVSHFIGDTIIDLTKAQIPFGETGLNVSAFIGDIKVFVPNDVDVEFHVNSSSFIGDITVFNRRESGFLRSMLEESPGFANADKKIRLQCSLFIGDIHVQRVG